MNKINKKEVRRRVVNQADYAGLVETGVSPVMARLYASRNIQADSLLPDIGTLPPKNTLEGCLDAGKMLADAVMGNKKLCIAADFDCDGCGSGAIMIRALRSVGADVSYIIPNRIKGYGLSVDLARRAKEMGCEVLVTVDNGVSAYDGVLEAKRLNMSVVITDHHISSSDGKLPNADVIVNPNIIGRTFKTRSLAGVGVAFYVLGALREELKLRGYPKTFNMAQMLDIVALSTVGDLVPLCSSNRALVNMGIDRIRTGQSVAGIKALLSVSNKNPYKTNTETLGYTISPKINASGRLQSADMSLELLITDDIGAALTMASQLDAINKERRAVQAEMTDEAMDIINNIDITGRSSLVVFSETFKEGVVGLVASAMKEKFSLPSCALAVAENGKLKGSLRSIEGVHVRDVVDLVAKRAPYLSLIYGGHCMAAGLGNLESFHLDEFIQLFDQAVKDLASPEAFNPYILTDGELGHGEISYELVSSINAENWGQTFPTPLFEGTFRVINQKIVGGTHTKLKLQKGMEQFDAILFSHDEPLPETIHALYKIGINEYQGVSTVQLMIEAINESNS
jgi:single-stranded-DNA-specific exonuclease